MTALPASIDAAEYAKLRADQMTEKQLQDVVTRLAGTLGWRAYHTHDSRRSQPGFPDLVLVHPRLKLTLWRELKTQKGKTSLAQDGWIRDLTAADQNAAVWRPIDYFTGRIEAQLRGEA